MADIPDVLPWIIGRFARKVHAYYGDIGYAMHASCMKQGFCA
jgi:hypothetical protein